MASWDTTFIVTSFLVSVNSSSHSMPSGSALHMSSAGGRFESLKSA
jgi:hypothetical protein